ncbi:hypothetical protein BP5796_00499 [Coleophoma crateriformis]|uniref:Uncharacterized protein n=1 Tax=Coleophoma crateriformis TaxID=565419 RepID=A0A3D8T863_9HELO|nr:hypothetical protein BP5796_00499 [Coleophoma crateriformis]
MSQTPRTKRPLDTLQGMINAILIETGRALRSSDKDAGRSMGPANARLRSTIPSAIENFHQALDDLENDIVQAKAVLGRDLEQLRAQRQAAENPIVEEEQEDIKQDMDVMEEEPSQAPVAIMTAAEHEPEPEPELEPVIKEEKIQTPEPVVENPPVDQDPPKESIIEEKQGPQIPSPPTSSDETTLKTNPAALGIDTKVEMDSQNPAPSTAGIPDSSIDSLFGDMVETTNENGQADLSFDDMDFSLHETNNNSTAEQTQTQEFDLSTFGDSAGNDVSLDFDMADLQPSTENNAGDITKNPSANQQVDLSDLFGTDNNTAGPEAADAGTGENMDLDLAIDMGEGDNTVFDDIFFGTGDDTGMGGGGIDEMEHGEFDNAFFGLED